MSDGDEHAVGAVMQAKMRLAYDEARKTELGKLNRRPADEDFAAMLGAFVLSTPSREWCWFVSRNPTPMDCEVFEDRAIQWALRSGHNTCKVCGLTRASDAARCPRCGFQHGEARA